MRLDDIVDEQSNVVGFSMFNTTHPFYLEFIRSLNLSWNEGCHLSYPGPAVSEASNGFALECGSSQSRKIYDLVLELTHLDRPFRTFSSQTLPMEL